MTNSHLTVASGGDGGESSHSNSNSPRSNAKRQHDNVMELIGDSVSSWIQESQRKNLTEEDANPHRTGAVTSDKIPSAVVDVDSLSTVEEGTEEGEELVPKKHSTTAISAAEHFPSRRNSPATATALRTSDHSSTTATTTSSSRSETSATGGQNTNNNNNKNINNSVRRAANPFRSSTMFRQNSSDNANAADPVKRAMSIAFQENSNKQHARKNTAAASMRTSLRFGLSGVDNKKSNLNIGIAPTSTTCNSEDVGGDEDASSVSLRPTLREIEDSNDHHSARYRYDETISQTKSRAIQELRHMASDNKQSIEDQEIEVRRVHDGGCGDTWDSIFSSLKVIFVFLLTKETYATMVLASASTCYFYFRNHDDGDWDGGGVPFVLLGVAVVIPTMNLISMEFGRRETALRRLADLRGVWIRIYQMHALLNWGSGKGRQNQKEDDEFYLGLGHLDDVGDNILGACDELMRFLTLPSSTETHNLLTLKGQMRATHILSVGEALFESCTARRGARFTILAERIKAAGASQTEMSRMEQFTKDMQNQYEHLRFLKMYRTPQALRSLARVTTIMMLPLFGPSFAYLAMNIGSIFFGLMLTVVSALILSGLFEAARVVEDPFTAFVVMDGINVREEMDTLYRQLCSIREEAFGAEARTTPYENPPSHCLTADNQFDDPESNTRSFASRSKKRIFGNDKAGHDTHSLIEKSAFRQQPKAKMVPRRRLIEAVKKIQGGSASKLPSDSDV